MTPNLFARPAPHKPASHGFGITPHDMPTSPPTPKPTPDCRVPLVLGVTGHRDLAHDDLPNLEAEVAKFIADLKRLCPGTPLVVLSQLAEGADRLAARVAKRAKPWPAKVETELPR